MLKLVKNIVDNKCNEVFVGTNTRWAISQGFKERDVDFGFDGKAYLKGYAPQKPLEQQLQEKKQEKTEELKSKRDELLVKNNYDFSENDKFNIINLIGYTELEKQEYLSFVKELKVKYDGLKENINKAVSVEELTDIIVEFK